MMFSYYIMGFMRGETDKFLITYQEQNLSNLMTAMIVYNLRLQ